MTTKRHQRLTFLLGSAAALFVTALPLAAHAQRQSPLADAPAIRKRLELRETRFEIGPGFTTTLGQDFYHSMFVDLRAAFHITDWLTLSAMGGYGVAQMQTAFGEKLTGSLKDVPPVPREPSMAAAKASMEQIKAMAAAQLEFVPFTGKFSLFGKVFAHYDFYAFGGIGFLQLEPTTASAALPACSDSGTGSSCAISGLKPGPTFGLGFHAFIKQWLALGFEGRDIVARINPSGRDVNGDGFARSTDINWASTYMFTANATFFLPSTAAISQ